MSTIIHAVFDGEVLRPEGTVNLEPNTRYVVTVEREDQDMERPEERSDQEIYPLTALLGLATDMDVTDLAENHDKYTHNRPEGNGAFAE
jgi:predicted DNA-binding antitoxin AbrB/MazE fold protein